MAASWLLAIACGNSTRQVPSSFAPQAPLVLPTILFIPDGRLNFGETWESRDFRWIVPIQNVSDATIQIDGFDNSCQCTKIEPKHFVLKPGESRDIEFTIDLLRGRRPETAGHVQEHRDFSLWLSPRITESAGSAIRRPDWYLRGKIRSALQVETLLLDLGEHSERSTVNQMGSLRVLEQSPLMSLEVESNSPQLTATVKRNANDASAFDISIACVPTASVGDFRHEVALIARLPSGERLPPLPLTVARRIVADIEVVPGASIEFGAQPLGSNSQERISLHSRAGRSFDVVSVQVDRAGTLVERIDDTTNRGRSYLVKQAIRDGGI